MSAPLASNGSVWSEGRGDMYAGNGLTRWTRCINDMPKLFAKEESDCLAFALRAGSILSRGNHGCFETHHGCRRGLETL